MLDYIGTLPEAADRHQSNVAVDPQRSIRRAAIRSPKTSPTRPSDLQVRYIGGWKNTRARRRRISREIASIDKYAGLSSEAAAGGRANGNIAGVSIFNPQFTFAPFGINPRWTGLPTKIAINTKSAYLIDTANYNDLVILNGGIRYDDYNIKASGFGTVNSVAQRLRCAGGSSTACRTSTSA